MSSTQKLLNPSPHDIKRFYGCDFGIDFGSGKDTLVETEFEIDKEGNICILDHKIIEP